MSSTHQVSKICIRRNKMKLIYIEPNAFVIPGGKVFVYTGLFDITKTEDGMAAVLGHEIAHNQAKQ